MSWELPLEVFKISDTSLFLVIAIVVITLVVKLKFDIDKSGLLTLFLHLLASVIRLTSTFIGIKLGITYALQSFVTSLIWFSLYYFTCELQLIQKHLEADNLEAFVHAKSQIKRKKLISGIILIIYALA